MLDSIIVGITKVRWVSAAGTLEGRVKRIDHAKNADGEWICLLYTSPSPRDRTRSRMPSSA